MPFRPTRIAIVINTSWNIYNFRMGLIEAFLEKGWDVLAIAPTDEFSDLLKAKGCTHIPLRMENKGSNPLKDLGLLVQFYTIYKTYAPDVILQYTIKPNIYGSIAAAKLKIPTINNVSGLGTVFLHQNLVSFLAQRLYAFAFQFPQKIFFQNIDDQVLFVEKKLVRPNKTGLLPGSGVKLSNYISTPCIKTEPLVFLFIGRLLYDKGILEFLEAAKYLTSRGIQAKFKILGFVEPEGGLGLSADSIQQWHDTGTIEYLGHTKDVKPFITASHVVVLPSYREGTPKSLLEALALGRPIVTTFAPGCKETVQEGKNGFFCTVKDIPSLANAMERMVHLSPEALEAMGKASRALAEEKFDEKIVIQKYLKEINLVLGKKGKV